MARAAHRVGLPLPVGLLRDEVAEGLLVLQDVPARALEDRRERGRDALPVLERARRRRHRRGRLLRRASRGGRRRPRRDRERRGLGRLLVAQPRAGPDLVPARGELRGLHAAEVGDPPARVGRRQRRLRVRDGLPVAPELEVQLRRGRARAGVQAQQQRHGRRPLGERPAEERRRAQGACSEGVVRRGLGCAHLVRPDDRQAAELERRAWGGHLERGAPCAKPAALAVLDGGLEHVASRRQPKRSLHDARPLPRSVDLGHRPLDRKVVAQARDERALLVLHLAEHAEMPAVGGLAARQGQARERHLYPYERLGVRLAAREPQRRRPVLDVAGHRRGREGLAQGQLVGQHRRRAWRQRVVAAARADDDARARHLDGDGPPASIGLRVGRGVADLVVRPQVRDHALEAGAEVVRLGHEKAPRALGEVPENALPVEPDRVLCHVRWVDAEGRVSLLRGEGGLAGQVERRLGLLERRADAQAPRVEGVDRDVGPVGRAHGGVEDRFDVRGDGEALGEVEERLAALHESEPARDCQERLQGRLALSLARDLVAEEEHLGLHPQEAGLRSGRSPAAPHGGALGLAGHVEGLLRGVVVPTRSSRIARLVHSARRPLDRRRERSAVLRERLKHRQAQADFEHGEDRPLRKGSVGHLEGRGARVPRGLRPQLVEDEPDDAGEALARGSLGCSGRGGWSGGRGSPAWGLLRSFRPYQPEGLNGASLAVLEDLHLVRAQVVDRTAGPVPHDEVEEHALGPRREDGRLGRLLRPGGGRHRDDDESDRPSG